MSSPFVGEIKMFGGNFAPQGWALCNGQLLQISENEALFQLIGTTYGGDGEQTFALPNLQSRIPIHQNQQGLGFQGGTENVTLSPAQLPVHTHRLHASERPATSRDPADRILARSERPIYSNGRSVGPMSSNAVRVAGGGQAHANTQPFLCVNFIISLFGIFPSPT